MRGGAAAGGYKELLGKLSVELGRIEKFIA